MFSQQNTAGLIRQLCITSNWIKKHASGGDCNLIKASWTVNPWIDTEHFIHIGFVYFITDIIPFANYMK